ncbi:MAG: inositol monophosphatase family protein, partial [Planctomycetaceae bacterium]
MTERYERELQTAIDAADLAARVCRSVQATVTEDVLEKDDRSPVTVADFASQAIVCRRLAETFPHDPIIAEEDAASLRAPENVPFLDRIQHELKRVGLDADAATICAWIDRGNAGDSSGRFWTLDPIDGTKGFLRGDQYAIAIALIVEGRVEVAALGCPNLGRPAYDSEPAGVVLWAVRGQGSWTLEMRDEREERREMRDEGVETATETATVQDLSSLISPHSSLLRVSPIGDPAGARFCEPFESGHSSHARSARVADQLGIRREPLRLDSQAKYGIVARGEAEIY